MRTPCEELFSSSTTVVKTGPQSTPQPEFWPGTNCVVAVGPEQGVYLEISPEPRDTGTTQQSFASMLDDHGTSITTRSTLLVLLEESALSGDHQMFAVLAEAVDWSTHLPGELSTAIDLALSLEMPVLAARLAQLGRHLFPSYERIQRAAQVLAPPAACVARLPEVRGMEASRRWLREHAKEYRGQWVAVREGELVEAAISLKELRTSIGQGEDAISTIFTKVL